LVGELANDIPWRTDVVGLLLRNTSNYNTTHIFSSSFLLHKTHKSAYNRVSAHITLYTEMLAPYELSTNRPVFANMMAQREN